MLNAAHSGTRATARDYRAEGRIGKNKRILGALIPTAATRANQNVAEQVAEQVDKIVAAWPR